jgi:hypothetical protein
VVEGVRAWWTRRSAEQDGDTEMEEESPLQGVCASAQCGWIRIRWPHQSITWKTSMVASSQSSGPRLAVHAAEAART